MKSAILSKTNVFSVHQQILILSFDLLLLQDNHYRPVGSDTCYPCNCYNIGSYGRSCDITGQCRCRTGVIGRRCDSCASKFAQVTLRGCEGKNKNYLVVL